MAEQIVWTVLPNGRTRGTLGFSLFISPRLLADGTLGNFGLGNWAQKMSSLKLTLQFDGGPTVAPLLDGSLLSPSLWPGLFPNSTPVRGWGLAPHASRELKSFPVASLHQFINGLYGQVASTPGSALSFPSLSSGPVADLVNTVGRLDEIICNVVGQPFAGTAAPQQRPPLICLPKDERVVLRTLGTTIARDFFLARQFYNRAPNDKISYLGQPVPPGSPPPEVPEVDFHQAVAMLGDWPRVLRMLGLVLDGVIDLANVAPAAAGRVRVLDLSYDQAGTTSNQTPWTHYQLDPTDFRPAPRGPDSDLAARLLRVGRKGAFEVMQVDVDGAALNVAQFATNQRRYQTEVQRSVLPAVQNQAPTGFGASAPQAASLPALRGGGITIARVERAPRLKANLIAATANHGLGDSASFYADDLLRGFRVDVETNGQWFSLCRRKARLELPGAGTLTFECTDGAPVFDEGYVKGSAGSGVPGDGPTDPLYIHESLFGWSGWSLVAARPGRVLTPMPDPMNPAAKKDQPVMPAPSTVPPAAQAKVPFDVESEVHAQPGTLPRLRYGRKYRLRARAVDLAGNSLPLETGPLVAPADVVSDEITYQRYEPVGSPVLGARSALTMGEHLETVVIRSKANAMASEEDLPSALFNATSERHILPPRTSQVTYETHGLLDGFGSPAASYEVAKRDSGSLQDRASDAQILNANGTVFADAANPADDGKWPAPGIALATGQYTVHLGDEVTVPWLPDPISVGAAFLGFPGSAFYTPAPFPGAPPAPGTAPDVRSLRLVLSSGPPAFGPLAGQLLAASLPPGTIVKLRYSSMVNPARLQELAIWNLMTPAAQSALQAFAVAGLLWMLSPGRDLLLVHAVERPVSPPLLTVAPLNETAKPIGRTFSELHGTVNSHSGSTAEVEIAASWEEVEDRLDVDTGESREPRTGHVGFLKIPYGEEARPFPKPGEDPPKHEFGDTKHRWMHYHLVGTTRFLENFPASVTNRRDLVTLPGPPAAVVDILSTRRPDPPRVAYIVPTFKWEESNGGQTRKRVGRGLRIYLERPWFSSGDDEKLGIVLGEPRASDPAGTSPPVISTAVRRYVSEWGSDPVTSGPVPNVNRDLVPADFVTEGKVTASDLTLAELDDNASLTVRAVGYGVTFNADRQLWYTDIELDPGRAYYPYLRLALARLQTHAVANAKLSPVVRADFVQLVADRTATVVRTVANNLEVFDITVVGYSASTALGERLVPTTTTQSAQVVAPPVVRPPGPPPVVGPPVIVDPPVLPGLVLNPAAGAGHAVRVHLERRPKGAAGDLGWERVTNDTTLASYTFMLFAAEVHWRGLVRRTIGPQDANFDFRLVIRELELFDTDADVSSVPLPPNSTAVPTPIGERLVYLDLFAVA